MKEVAWMKEGLFNASTPEATESEHSEAKGTARVIETPNPEVPEKAARRKFSAEYKLRILQLGESCTDPGSLGRLLRNEGLYYSARIDFRDSREAWA